MVKRAREQALREKRELKQAKKDARAEEKRLAAEGIVGEGTDEESAEANVEPTDA
jgi:hypothetical protein